MVLKIYFMFFGIINFFRSKRNKNVCILQLNYIFKEETSLSLSLSCLNLLNIQAWSFWLFLFVLLETSPVFRSVCAWKILGSGRRRHDIALISAKKSNRIELLAIKIFLCKLMETLKGLLTSEWETKLELELEQRACNLQISTSPGDWLALIAPIAHFNCQLVKQTKSDAPKFIVSRLQGDPRPIPIDSIRAAPCRMARQTAKGPQAMEPSRRIANGIIVPQSRGPFLALLGALLLRHLCLALDTFCYGIFQLPSGLHRLGWPNQNSCILHLNAFNL